MFLELVHPLFELRTIYFCHFLRNLALRIFHPLLNILLDTLLLRQAEFWAFRIASMAADVGALFRSSARPVVLFLCVVRRRRLSRRHRRLSGRSCRGILRCWW